MKNQLKNIIKIIFSEKSAIQIGNLTYLTILAAAPTLIIIVSILNILINKTPLQHNEYSLFLTNLLSILNLDRTLNIFVTIICINLLSSGLFSLLTYFENIYHFKIGNYFKKKLYSIILVLFLIASIILNIFCLFYLTKYPLLEKLDFIINCALLFIFLLIFYKLIIFQKIKHLFLGALFSSFILAIFLKFYYYIIYNFTKLSDYYGVLTPIISILLLTYYSCYIIYIGILINHESLKTSIINKNR